MNQGLPIRWTCVVAGLGGIIGVLMLGASFAINNAPPLSSPDSMFLSFATTHRMPVLWGAWLQAVGPALIVALAFTLVSLSGAHRRVAGLMTVFGATALMIANMMEIACYIGELFTTPDQMPRIANTFAFATQHLYFFIAAPALFLPLGFVLLGSSVLPRLFGWLALLLGAAFFVLGITSINDLVLPTGVTAFAAVQSLWWFFAALALIFRSGRLAREASSSQRAIPENSAVSV